MKNNEGSFGHVTFFSKRDFFNAIFVGLNKGVFFFAAIGFCCWKNVVSFEKTNFVVLPFCNL